MKCVFCKKGETKPKRVTYEHYNEKGELAAVFKNFPAEVCEYCGEEYYQAKDLKKVESILKARDKIKETIKVPVVNF